MDAVTVITLMSVLLILIGMVSSAVWVVATIKGGFTQIVIKVGELSICLGRLDDKVDDHEGRLIKLENSKKCNDKCVQEIKGGCSS